MIFGTPEIIDDINVLWSIARAEFLADLPVIDIEAVLEILFASIDDVARGDMTLKEVVGYLVRETIDFKSSNFESAGHLIDLLLTLYQRIYNEVLDLGMINNGRFQFAYKAVQLDGTLILQRADLDT